MLCQDFAVRGVSSASSKLSRSWFWSLSSVLPASSTEHCHCHHRPNHTNHPHHHHHHQHPARRNSNHHNFTPSSGTIIIIYTIVIKTIIIIVKCSGILAIGISSIPIIVITATTITILVAFRLSTLLVSSSFLCRGPLQIFSHLHMLLQQQKRNPTAALHV